MLQDLINSIKQRYWAWRLEQLPENALRRIGYKTYNYLYDEVRHDIGDEIGLAKVTFTCPYPAHVSYHIEPTLNARINDESDVTQNFKLDRNGDTYTLFVMASASKDPDHAADVSAMSAILTIPTVGTTFERALYLTHPKDRRAGKGAQEECIDIEFPRKEAQ